MTTSAVAAEPSPAPTPMLKPLFSLRAELAMSDETGDGPSGRRFRDGVGSGAFFGPRMKGVVLPGSADWRIIRRDGTSVVDARVMLRTDDGAVIYMSYAGRAIVPPDLLPQIRDPARRQLVDPALYYFRTVPVFETGAPAYAWLNDIVAVGSGRLSRQGVDYEVFEVG